SLISCFIQEDTANQMCRKLEISYNTAYKAVTAVRFAIVAQALDSRQYFGRDAEIDISKVQGKAVPGTRGACPVPVFGILEKLGLVFVDLMSGLDGETLFHFHMNFHLTMVRMGKLLYTDKYKQYDSLIACGNGVLPYGILSAKKEIPTIDQRRSGFWQFAKKRLKRYSGITPQRFPLYIKELEFRYNHREQDIFSTLVKYLCDFVPKQE
ncbi:MAG: transposase, partial [Desulfovibrionales bacterium]